MLQSNNLKPNPFAIKKKKRVGRGTSSGHGKTCCRGHKGQKSRSGGTKGPSFEGGQTPIYRRLPKKRGFKNILFRSEYRELNLGTLSGFEGEVKIADLIKAKIMNEGEKVKVLAKGEITKPLLIEAHKFSQNAIKKIEKAGGKAIPC